MNTFLMIIIALTLCDRVHLSLLIQQTFLELPTHININAQIICSREHREGLSTWSLSMISWEWTED